MYYLQNSYNINGLTFLVSYGLAGVYVYVKYILLNHMTGKEFTFDSFS